MSYFELHGFLIPRLAVGLSIVLIYLILAFALRRFLFNSIARLARESETRWDDAFVAALRAPLALIILASAGWIGLRYMRLPEGWNQSIDQLTRIGLILAFVLFVDRILRESVSLYRSRLEGINLTEGFARAIVRGVVLVLGTLIVLDTLHISVTPILASLGVGGLAVGLALQGTLSNLFSGLQIISTKPIRVGDFIRIQNGEEGYVTEIGWRATRICMLPNNTVVVPNSQLADSVIVNFYLPDKELAVLVQVGVSYDSDLTHVERVTIEVARQTQQEVQGAVPDFQPFIRYHTFDSSSINFSVILRGREFVDQHLIKHEFIKRLHARYNQEGIVIPWPIRTLDIPKETIQALTQPSRGGAADQK